MIDLVLPDGIRGFEPAEAYNVIDNYVCAVCWSTLLAIQVQGDRIMLVVCPEHGNIEQCGRITKNSVSIELENGAKNYHKVIRNLSDLWGHLIAQPEFKCAKCGYHQVKVEPVENFPNMYRIICPRHPEIIQSVMLKESKNANQRSN